LYNYCRGEVKSTTQKQEKAMPLANGEGKGGQAVWLLPDGHIIHPAIQVDSAGNEASGGVVDTPIEFKDTNFVTGSSGVIHDINGSSLGRNATTVTILNDGPGELTFALSNNGNDFGNEITLKNTEGLTFNVSVDSVRVTWVADSAYRVVAI
jgi:hypothetical protein